MSVVRATASWLALVVLCGLLAPAAVGDEAAILAGLREFFATEDAARRAAIAKSVEADAAFDRAELSGWLHRAVAFPPLRSPRDTITVALSGGGSRTVELRVPKSYDPASPSPLIYALHGTGGDGESIIRYLEQVLGDRADEFLIAAPTGYEDVVLKSSTPWTGEHAEILRELRRHAHVDSDRIFVTGYSRGGHASWTLAVVHPDLFAGAMPLAGTLLLPEYDVLFDTFLPNIGHTPTLACWGAADTGSADSPERSPDGGIAGINRLITKSAGPLKLPLTLIEDPQKGHGGIAPPADALTTWLSHKREASPKSFRHTFRTLEQGGAWWVEPRALVGRIWDDAPLELSFQAGESPGDREAQRRAMGRAIRAQLCELRGEAEGQKLKVTRKNVKSLIVWLDDALVSFDKPVALYVSGEKVFEGKVKPDLLLCLTEAARSRDFDHLRFAGLEWTQQGGRARPVRPDARR